MRNECHNVTGSWCAGPRKGIDQQTERRIQWYAHWIVSPFIGGSDLVRIWLMSYCR